MRFKPLAFFRFPSWAQTPTPLVLSDRIRIYIAKREDGKSYISYADLDLDDPTIMLGEGGRVLGIGKPCAFDQDGQMPSFAVRRKHWIDLYYSGWLALKEGYHNATGLVRCFDGGENFVREYDGPIMDRTRDEPYLAVTPCFFGDTCWYITGDRWERINDRLEPIYHIAASTNGARGGEAAIKRNYDLECFSRPWVIHAGLYLLMFFCSRSAEDYRDGPGAYHIEWAVSSDDGKTWTRKGEIDLPRSDWDRKMQAYPSLFFAKGKLYMLYNGDSFGKHGFGLAVCDD